jgi:hypothetical protein
MGQPTKEEMYWIAAFERLVQGKGKWGIMPCLLDGRSHVAICEVEGNTPQDAILRPLFVSVTDEMDLTGPGGEQPEKVLPGGMLN